jgi:hypothetical protein
MSELEEGIEYANLVKMKIREINLFNSLIIENNFYNKHWRHPDAELQVQHDLVFNTEFNY